MHAIRMKLGAVIKFVLASLLGALLLGACALGWWRYFAIRVRVSLAEEQTRYFQEAVERGIMVGSPQEVDGFIEAIERYYPSGSKQLTGSHLDVMVERARAGAVATLRERGKSLPSDSGAGKASK